MLKKLLHQLVAIPWVYDLVQYLAGSPALRRAMRIRLADLPSGACVVDVGGGTGLNFSLLPQGTFYICLDTDLEKLAGFHSKIPTGLGLLGDAAKMPLQSQSADLVLCTFVSHHIPDEQLATFFEECARILKPGGAFFFVDAVWEPGRWISQLMWKYDRGSHPRPEAAIKQAFQRYFMTQTSETMEIYHRYIFLRGGSRTA